VRLDPTLETRVTQESRRLGFTKSEFVKDALERVLGLKNPADLLSTVRSGKAMGNPQASRCIVEASYLLEIPQRFEMLKWIELGGTVVYPIEPTHLGDIARWMRRYSESGKHEMDLADASLYWLAAETGVTEILTVEVADFSRYRTDRPYRLARFAEVRDMPLREPESPSSASAPF
jgi:hypothetical protein